MPKRIQRQRTKGWRMPEGTVYVGRPTKWGNPFTVEDHGHHGARYRHWQWLQEPEQADLVAAIRTELRGKDLACWCREGLLCCHADTLLRIANSEGEA